MKKKQKEESDKKKITNQLRVIEKMAIKLPWIAVLITLISMLFILLELYYRNSS